MIKYLSLVFAFALCSLACSARAATDSTTVQAADTAAWDIALEGVTVTAQRQLVKQEIDRVSYDVQADRDAKTLTVSDLLPKVPMVAVDGEDNILVKGSKNFKVYKNGRYDPNLTQNAKEIFKALPASLVKRIEVITDPGAREDAEGVTAILNIVMVDSKGLDGVTGRVNASHTTLKHTNLGACLATQLGKLNLQANYSYSYMSKKETTTTGYDYRQYVPSGNIEESYIHSSNAGKLHYASIDASYDIDTINLLSASFGGYFFKLDVDGFANSYWTNKNNEPLYSYREHYWLPGYGHHSWNGRMDYERRTRLDGEKITLSYMLALTRQHTNQETTYDDMVNVPFDYAGFLSAKRERFTEHTFQLDYVRPVGDSHKLEAGAKYIDRRNGSRDSQELYRAAQQPPMATAFDHTTRIAAVYADYRYNKGDWSARAGLRYEYSYMLGDYPDGASPKFDKRLSDWVPQASVKYQLDGRQSLKLGYVTGITRPGITYLNPAQVISPSSVTSGNARLASAREQRLQLAYMYVGRTLTLQLTPQYVFSNNQIGKVVYADGDTRYSTFGNVTRLRQLQVEAYVQWKPFSTTTLAANLNYRHVIQRNRQAHLSLACDPLNYYINISQRLPWKLNVAFSAYGQAGHAQTSLYAYMRSWQRYSFTLRRSFLSEDRLTVSLRANSLFNKRGHYRTRTVQGDILGHDDMVNAQNGRQFQLSVGFRFGKLKPQVKKPETTILNDDIVGGITQGT